ncbi:MAG: NAD(P)H-dependent oxidoreductase, partial [Giesbergeria sp.]
MQLLHIDSAITGAQSVSRQLSRQTVESWVAAHPGTQVTHLDLAANAPAHLTQDALSLRFGQTEALTAAQENENAVTERLLAQ